MLKSINILFFIFFLFFINTLNADEYLCQRYQDKNYYELSDVAQPIGKAFLVEVNDEVFHGIPNVCYIDFVGGTIGSKNKNDMCTKRLIYKSLDGKERFYKIIQDLSHSA